MVVLNSLKAKGGSNQPPPKVFSNFKTTMAIQDTTSLNNLPHIKKLAGSGNSPPKGFSFVRKLYRAFYSYIFGVSPIDKLQGEERVTNVKTPTIFLCEICNETEVEHEDQWCDFCNLPEKSHPYNSSPSYNTDLGRGDGS